MAFPSDTIVDLWTVDLSLPFAREQDLMKLLSADELHRADAFVFDEDRTRYICWQGSLRCILGGYLGISPALVTFERAEFGKPFLCPAINPSDIRFNISHSHTLMLVAVARARELGIDVEYHRDNIVAEQIPERFLSPREVVQLRALPLQLQQRAFFNCWTRKEAYIKALGEGLSHPLHSFDVSFAPDADAALRYVAGNPEELTRWSFHNIELGSSYSAALVVEGSGCSVRKMSWQRSSSIDCSLCY
jgi:4'-phosphopantetheinyl transferase